MTLRWQFALVTGASTGIGEQFCRILAAEGTNLVLVARDEGRLRRLAEELTDDYAIEVEVLPADLTVPEDRARVSSRIEKSHNPIDLLINNAGLGFTGDFIDQPISKHHEQLSVNVTALVELAYAAASTMTLSTGGTILNVSSVAGDLPGPKSAVYNATKAFVTSFSQSLGMEMSDRNVTVSCLCPGLTRTEFQARAGYDTAKIPDTLWQSARTVAEVGLDGAADQKAVITSGLVNKVWSRLNRSAPRGIGRRAAQAVNRK